MSFFSHQTNSWNIKDAAGKVIISRVPNITALEVIAAFKDHGITVTMNHSDEDQ